MRSPPAGARMVPAPPDDATRLVLIRHGESACAVAGVVGGPAGCTGLSELGRYEATALRDRLLETRELAGAGALYTSILERAVQTATIASPGIGAGLRMTRDCALCELHPGEGDGLRWDEFVERYGKPDFDSDPDAVLCPGAESWSGFVRRASRALAALVARHPGELVVVVCHAGVVEASMLAFLPLAPSRPRLGLRTAHTSLTEWEVDGAGWRLLRYNDTAHLSNGRR